MRDILSNSKISLAAKIICTIAVIATCLAAIAFFRADIRTLLSMMMFSVFYILLPGMLFVNTAGLKGEHLSTYLSRSFFIGFALNVFLYFFSDLIGADLLLWISGPILSLLYIWRCYKKKESFIFAPKRVPASAFLFFAVVFISSMLTTQFTYISPAFVDFSSIKIDFAYHAGIINALAEGFPPEDPWISGRIIEYHYFTEMLYSIPVRIFNIASEEALLSFTPYMIAPVFSVSLYSFFREFSSRKERAGLYCLATHFSNMFMIKEFSNSWLFYHIYSNINNAGMGLACLLAALPVLKNWDKTDKPCSKRFNTKEMLMFAVLVILMSGIKGPVSIVFIAGLIGTSILGLILRKVDKGIIAVTGMGTIAFILVYVYILGAQHSNETGGRLINLWEVTDIFFLKDELMDPSVGGGSIGKIAVLISFVICYLMAFTIPFIVGYIREFAMVVSGKKKYCFSKIVIYASCVVGFAAMMIVDFAGHSQVYFGFVASILVPIIAFWFIEDLEEGSSAWYKSVKTVFLICLCLSAATSLMYIAERAQVAQGYYMARNDNAAKYRNVSAKEYEGLLWLKNNTEKDALIASDRYNSVSMDEYTFWYRGHNTHFSYAVYSGRRQYIEGSGFSLEDKDSEIREEMIKRNDELYNPMNNNRGEMARELGIDYLVVSKRFNKIPDLSNNDYEIAFSNEEMDIYKIKN